MYLDQQALQPALTAIDEAIDANRHIPDELWFVPKNLAIKAAILARLGAVNESNDLYEKSADMLDAFLTRCLRLRSRNLLLSELDTVYAGYFESLGNGARSAEIHLV